MMVSAAFAMLLAAQADPLALAIPLAIPVGASYVVDHADIRLLPDGGSAVFRERSQIEFTPAGDALIVSVRSAGRSCEGPVPICAAFNQLGAASDGRLHRFRLNLADHSLVLLEGGVTLAGGQAGETSGQVAAALAEREAVAPGATIAADVRQLIRFAAISLPPAGTWLDVPEGRVRVTSADASQVVLVIDRPASAAGEVTLNGSGECRISRSTGLVEQCRYIDWLGDDSANPIRTRTFAVTGTARAVS